MLSSPVIVVTPSSSVLSASVPLALVALSVIAVALNVPFAFTVYQLAVCPTTFFSRYFLPAVNSVISSLPAVPCEPASSVTSPGTGGGGGGLLPPPPFVSGHPVKIRPNAAISASKANNVTLLLLLIEKLLFSQIAALEFTLTLDAPDSLFYTAIT